MIGVIVTIESLKAAIRRLVKDCGGQESCGLMLDRRRHEYFSEAGDVRLHADWLRLDYVPLMEADCGVPHITRELARATGHELVKLPSVAQGKSPLGRITGEAMRRVAEVFVALGQALEDDRITPAEDVRIETEIDEAILTLLRLKLQVRADAEAGNG